MTQSNETNSYSLPNNPNQKYYKLIIIFKARYYFIHLRLEPNIVTIFGKGLVCHSNTSLLIYTHVLTRKHARAHTQSHTRINTRTVQSLTPPHSHK